MEQDRAHLHCPYSWPLSAVAPLRTRFPRPPPRLSIMPLIPKSSSLPSPCLPRRGRLPSLPITQPPPGVHPGTLPMPSMLTAGGTVARLAGLTTRPRQPPPPSAAAVALSQCSALRSPRPASFPVSTEAETSVATATRGSSPPARLYGWTLLDGVPACSAPGPATAWRLPRPTDSTAEATSATPHDSWKAVGERAALPLSPQVTTDSRAARDPAGLFGVDSSGSSPSLSGHRRPPEYVVIEHPLSDAGVAGHVRGGRRGRGGSGGPAPRRTYGCTYPGCNSQARFRSNAKAHARLHTGEQPYVCQVRGCGKRFRWASSMSYHRKRHAWVDAEAAAAANEVMQDGLAGGYGKDGPWAGGDGQGT